jgi:glutamine amidotransferase
VTDTATIVDYGAGNIASVANMLRRLGHASRISSDPAEVAAAARLIIPGVGHFAHAMEQVGKRGLRGPLDETRKKRVPILGICLGAQLLLSSSEEGPAEGLGWIPGRVLRFQDPRDAAGRPLPVPHMGWRRTAVEGSHPFTAGWTPESRFYYVHSYCLTPDDPGDVVATADYGGRFCSAVARGNVCGVQFHPEKSHRYGMAVLDSFMKWTPA